MKVLYDLSFLGIGHSNRAHRTGIFRTVEHVALGLATSGGCELSFCASQSLRALRESRDYRAACPAIRDIPLVDSAIAREVERRLVGGILRINQRGKVRFPHRMVRRALWEIIQLAERQFDRRNAAFAAEVDVFHSPAFPLPRPLPRSQSPQRVLSIYDLIPVRFPHLFEEQLVHGMKVVYDSLRPEDWALAISEATKADLCEYQGVDPARVFVAHLAADPELFYPETDAECRAAVRRRYGIPEAPYVLSLNTLEPRKNMDHAIRAFASLVRQERIPDLYFVLVGAKGWHYEKIFAAIAEAGEVRERIILTGYVEDADLAALYSGALAFVYPSLYEGFGLPPLEAMQCGVPVITSNTSSLPEVVGDAGILLDPHDRDGLCQSLLALYGNPTLQEELCATSLARARLFNWERCVQEILAGYRTALAA